MSLSLVASKNFCLEPVGSYSGTYSGFEVGYFGDRAGVHFDFVTPVTGVSEAHLKYKTITTPVVTKGEQFDSASLQRRIDELEAAGDDRNLEVLLLGQKELANFIKLNGMTNPAEGLDWAYN